jgi:hypothetical protein
MQTGGGRHGRPRDSDDVLALTRTAFQACATAYRLGYIPFRGETKMIRNRSWERPRAPGA